VGVADGGGGASLVDLAVVVHEWGRRLAPVPLVEHAVCADRDSRIVSVGGPCPPDRHLLRLLGVE